MQEGTRARGERGSRSLEGLAPLAAAPRVGGPGALGGSGHEAARLADRTWVPGEALTQRDHRLSGALPERRRLAPGADEMGHLHLALLPRDSIVGEPERELGVCVSHDWSPSFVAIRG